MLLILLLISITWYCTTSVSTYVFFLFYSDDVLYVTKELESTTVVFCQYYSQSDTEIKHSIINAICWLDYYY